ncbi:hypothetical protein GGF46_000645 [Coemansia sp. RSA 552]|nr:hypothetical protein GGF46_000645 [Coemansia sp. RSA 552]
MIYVYEEETIMTKEDLGLFYDKEGTKIIVVYANEDEEGRYKTYIDRKLAEIIEDTGSYVANSDPRPILVGYVLHSYYSSCNCEKNYDYHVASDEFPIFVDPKVDSETGISWGTVDASKLADGE